MSKQISQTNTQEKRSEGGPKFQSLIALHDEMVIARAKFPSNKSLLLALVEEVGEVARARLEQGPDSQDFRQECLQVACVAMRLYEEGDHIPGGTISESQNPA